MIGFSDLDLRLLRVFMVVARSGGFTAAEAVLNVSQSTISNQMAALEQRLGYSVCRRGRAGFKLTEKGQAIIESAERLFSAIDEYRAKANGLRGEFSGELRVGVADSTTTDPNCPMVEAFRKFNQRKHFVTLEVVMADPQELELGVLKGKLHLAITGGFPKKITGLNYRPLYSERNRFFCGVGHPLFGVPDSNISLSDLSRYRIVSKGYWGLRDVVRLGFKSADARSNEIESELMLILSGSYLGFLPDHVAESWVRRGMLHPILPSELDHIATFSVVTPKGNIGSPAAEAFLTDLLAANAKLNGNKGRNTHLRLEASRQ
jgi:DNA-binding transcriptional LysR family regulator